MRLSTNVFTTGAMTALLTSGLLRAQAPPPVPAAYQDLYDSLSTELQSFDSTLRSGWNGSSYAYLRAPQLEAANSDQYTQLLNATYYTYAVEPQLDELQALGANAVTIHINFPIFYQPFFTYAGNTAQYQQFVSFYQQLAQDVRGRGMKLVVEAALGMPTPDNYVSSFQAYLKTLTWPEYEQGRAINALTAAQLLEPDYMTVMIEPDQEAFVSGQANLKTVSGVIELVQNTLTVLKNNGITNVKVGGGAGTWTENYMQYVQALAALPMDFVDMHIFPISRDYFTNALTAADAIHAAGKEVGLSECWLWKIRDSELGNVTYQTIVAREPFSFWEGEDTAFLHSITNLAKYKQFAFIAPYYTHYFFAYLDYSTYGLLPQATVMEDSDAAADSAILNGQITPTGHNWEILTTARDTTPPATPAAPTTTAIGSTIINLAWQPDSDNIGVSAYNLYRNGSLLTTTSLLLYYDKGLVSGETYTYTLTATDASGNISAMSAPLIVETVDLTAPTVPTKLVASDVTSNSVTLNWALSTGIGGVGGYRVLRGTSPTSLAIHANVTAPPYTDPYLQPSTTYYYEVESYNPIGVTSGPSNEVTIKSKAK
jgi:hypothetical protein